MTLNEAEKVIDVSNQLPVDEGHKAFRSRIHHSKKPYGENDWRHNEWDLGWGWEEEGSDGVFNWATDDFESNNGV